MIDAPVQVVDRMPIAPDVARLQTRFGVPTAPLVKLLQDKFQGKLKPERQIFYSEIEECISLPRTSGRFRSVVAAWKRNLETEYNVLLRPNRVAKGYDVADGNERLRFSAKGYGNAMKSVRRVARIAQKTGELELTPDKVRFRDHFVRTTATMLLMHDTESKALEYPTLEKKRLIG